MFDKCRDLLRFQIPNEREGKRSLFEIMTIESFFDKNLWFLQGIADLRKKVAYDSVARLVFELLDLFMVEDGLPAVCSQKFLFDVIGVLLPELSPQFFQIKIDVVGRTIVRQRNAVAVENLSPQRRNADGPERLDLQIGAETLCGDDLHVP